MVSPGQTVKAWVISKEADKKKIGLSLVAVRAGGGLQCRHGPLERPGRSGGPELPDSRCHPERTTTASLSIAPHPLPPQPGTEAPEKPKAERPKQATRPKRDDKPREPKPVVVPTVKRDQVPPPATTRPVAPAPFHPCQADPSPAQPAAPLPPVPLPLLAGRAHPLTPSLAPFPSPHPPRARRHLRLPLTHPPLPCPRNPPQWVEGTITKVLGFGVVVEVEPGVEGLLHVSEMSGALHRERHDGCGRPTTSPPCASRFGGARRPGPAPPDALQPCGF